MKRARSLGSSRFARPLQIAACRDGKYRQCLQHLGSPSRQIPGQRTGSRPGLKAQMKANTLTAFPDGGYPPEALISDLDGTLTETELLKARSYARTVLILLEGSGLDQFRLLDEATAPSYCIKALEEHSNAKGTLICSIDEESEHIKHDLAQRAANAALQSYLSNIGGTTEDVARGIVETLCLEQALIPKMEEYGLKEPWQALYRWRKEIYASTFATDENISDARYTHNINLLRRASESGLRVAVATQSLTEDAERVTAILGIRDCLTSILGREKVQNPKPDPDIYLAAAKELGAAPERCLVIEDSVTGLTAAVRAGMGVVAVANPFSKSLLEKQTILCQDAIVYDPKNLDRVVQQQCRALHARYEKL